MGMEQALSGIKVLDLSWVITGPLSTSYLGAFGAEVIKIESQRNLDVVRSTPPYKDNIPGIDRSGCFITINGNKKSFSLNIAADKSRKILHKFVAWADIVIEAFRPGVIDKLGLGYQVLKQINPKIIMVSASIQGQTGPVAGFMGYGFNSISLSGLANLTGWPDRKPASTANAYTDSVPPWFIVAVILSALDYRERTGKGQYIDITQYETALQFISPYILDYIVNNNLAERQGNRCDYASPHGIFRCRGENRWIAISIHTQEEWNSFCKIAGNPVWVGSSRFSTFHERKENEDELEKLVEQWTLQYSDYDIMHLLQGSGVPAGVVQSNRDIWFDPQLWHRQHFQLLKHPVSGLCHHFGWPAILSATPQKLSPSPCFGQHNEYVRKEILKMSEEEYKELATEGIFE